MSCKGSLKFTNFATSLNILSSSLAFVLIVLPLAANASSQEDILREVALSFGLALPAEVNPDVNEALSKAGESVFESRFFSLNSDVSCRDCHLDEFGSADGIPIAIGIGGSGRGPARVKSNGDLLPRNTLALWGRGGKNFDVFFWDGRVDFSRDQPLTQFGAELPSNDPLVTAVHLPIVEIGEMLNEDSFVRERKQEEIETADEIYREIVSHFIEKERSTASDLAKAIDKDIANLAFVDFATGLAAFIRSEFALQETKFHRFVFRDAKLSAKELHGAELFYGKGKCVLCHNGAYFSDLDFHSIAFPQLGFGRNGFGVDYGRYNVTHDARDLYLFRTPPLLNVAKTAPYGHSGSVATINEAIVAHFDPLRVSATKEMDALQRTEFYKRLLTSRRTILSISHLSDDEIDSLVAFLRTLSF